MSESLAFGKAVAVEMVLEVLCVDMSVIMRYTTSKLLMFSNRRYK